MPMGTEKDVLYSFENFQMLFENYTYMETSLELAKVIFGKMHSQ
jgi:hypothetical protein